MSKNSFQNFDICQILGDSSETWNKDEGTLVSLSLVQRQTEVTRALKGTGVWTSSVSGSTNSYISERETCCSFNVYSIIAVVEIMKLRSHCGHTQWLHTLFTWAVFGQCVCVCLSVLLLLYCGSLTQSTGFAISRLSPSCFHMWRACGGPDLCVSPEWGVGDEQPAPAQRKW